MTVHVLALTVELRLSDCRSLKEKRSVVTPIVQGARRRFDVAAAETARQDEWQAAELGFAAVSGSVRVCGDLLDAVERFVWSFPEVEVSEMSRHWLEVE